MAGNYPDPPSYRMAWDRDGTQVFFITNTGVSMQYLSTELPPGNDEDDKDSLSAKSEDAGYFVFIFPELRDLDGWVHWSNNYFRNMIGDVEVSSNTTNGIDGTWTSMGTSGGSAGSKTDLRQDIISATALGIKAVRFESPSQNNYPTTVYCLHLYGEPSPGQGLDKLELWDPALDKKIDPAHLDWGDAARGSSAQKQFRVKNISSSMTATDIRVAMEVLTDASPSTPGQFSLEYQSGGALAQIHIGDLAPGQISDTITMRRNTLDTAQLSLWWFRVFAEAATWV